MSDHNLNRLQQYIAKASFAHSADKIAAMKLAGTIGDTTQNQERLAGIIAEIVTTLGIDVEGCNLGPGPDICALGDEAVAALHARVRGRAEELIACLEAEIVKRDARIDHKDLAIVNLQSALASVRNELAALKAQPSAGVAMPEPLKRGDEGGSGEYGAAMIRGFNACLREVARLNAGRAQSVQRCQCCGYLATESEHRGCLRSAAVAVPDGYVLVPVEPTEEMITAMEDAEAVVIRDWHDLPHGGKGRTVEIRELAVYRAAIAAAQSVNHTEQNLDMVQAAQQKEAGDE